MFCNIFADEVSNDTRAVSEKCDRCTFREHRCPAAETSSPFHAQARRIAFYEHFIVLPHHENSSSWRFPRNAIRGRRLLNFSTFRSVLRRISASRRALYSPGSLCNNWISAADLARKCVVIVRTGENNTADMPFAGRAANYRNPTQIINGPFTRHLLPPISIRWILFVPSALSRMT